MLAIRRFGVPPRKVSSFVNSTIMPRLSAYPGSKSIGVTTARQPSAATILNHSTSSSAAAAAVAAAPRYLARSWPSSLGMAKQGCGHWTRSCFAGRGLGARANRGRMLRMNAGLSTLASKPSGAGLRLSRMPPGGVANGNRVGGGNARNMSYLPQGGGSKDTMVVYGLVGVSYTAITRTYNGASWYSYQKIPGTL